MSSSIRSRLSARSGTPAESLQEQNFSTIQAARPAGESTREYPMVCGLVDCWAE